MRVDGEPQSFAFRERVSAFISKEGFVVLEPDVLASKSDAGSYAGRFFVISIIGAESDGSCGLCQVLNVHHGRGV